MRIKRTRVFGIGAGLLGLGLAFGLGVAVGQPTAPTKTTGVQIGPPTAMDLAPEIDSLEGRQLRLRVVTLEPGAVIGIHTHKGRPGVAYMLKGTVVEHREGGWVTERHQGDAWTEGKDVTHWAENRSGEPAVVVAIDVFKP